MEAAVRWLWDRLTERVCQPSPPPLPEGNAELASLFDDWANPFDEGARFAYITDGVGVERERDACGRWVYSMA